MKKRIIWIPLIGMISFIMSFIMSCDDTQVKPKDEEPIVVVPPVYGINVVLALEDSVNVTLPPPGERNKYYMDVSNEKEWTVTFIALDNYEVKEVFENGVSLGKIKSYSYKRNKDVNLKVVFGLVPQMLKLINTTWRIYEAYDSIYATKEIQYIRIGEIYGTLTETYRANGKYEVRIVGAPVYVYNWHFTNPERTIIYRGVGSIVNLRYIEDKVLIYTTDKSNPDGSPDYATVIKYYNIKYPKPKLE